MLQHTAPYRWGSDWAEGEYGEDRDYDVCGVWLDGGDGVLGDLHRGHLHLEGLVPYEDGEGPRWARLQHARPGEGVELISCFHSLALSIDQHKQAQSHSCNS